MLHRGPPDVGAISGSSLHDRVELARRFNRVYPEVQDLPAVAALRARVAEYLERLAELGLDDRVIRRPLTRAQLAWRVARQLLLALVWLPLAIFGAPIHAPVLLALYLGSERLSPRKDAIATTKLLVGLVLLVLLYLVLIAVGWSLVGWGVGAAVAVLLPLTGYARLVVLGRFGSIDRKVNALLGALLFAPEVEELRTLRADLERDVIAAVERLIPEDMVPLFPREAGAPDP